VERKGRKAQGQPAAKSEKESAFSGGEGVLFQVPCQRRAVRVDGASGCMRKCGGGFGQGGKERLGGRDALMRTVLGSACNSKLLSGISAQNLLMQRKGGGERTRDVGFLKKI